MNATPTNQFHQTQRTWRFPRLLLEDQLALAGLSWVGTIVTFAIIVIGVSLVRDIVNSGWEVATSIIPWYAAFIGGYVLHTVLPMNIAHGRTRRDFAIEALIFAGIFTTVVAALTTVGFVCEQGLYAIGDWSRKAPDGHLFTSFTAYGTIFAEFWLTVLVWTTVGAFVGAALYREPEAGWLAVVPAIVLIALAGITVDERSGPMGFIMNRLPSIDSSSLVLTAALSIGCFLVALAMTWLIVRDTPLRNRS